MLVGQRTCKMQCALTRTKSMLHKCSRHAIGSVPMWIHGLSSYHCLVPGKASSIHPSTRQTPNKAPHPMAVAKARRDLMKADLAGQSSEATPRNIYRTPVKGFEQR